jgi:hypothetical protein
MLERRFAPRKKKRYEENPLIPKRIEEIKGYRLEFDRLSARYIKKMIVAFGDLYTGPRSIRSPPAKIIKRMKIMKIAIRRRQ